MRKFVLIGCLCLAVGCQNVAGPRQHRDNPVRVDDPMLSISDQQRLGRDRLAIPDNSVAPPGQQFQGPTGR